MRKVTKTAAMKFNSGQKFKSGNTQVDVSPEEVALKLHGNTIARKTNEGLFVSNCGWFSNTTKERLNALEGVSIQQKNFVWYLNGKEWDGKTILIK